MCTHKLIENNYRYKQRESSSPVICKGLPVIREREGERKKEREREKVRGRERVDFVYKQI